ncbi:MAG: hypothetical protein RIB45_06800 [Marivibrio sp.]|uniref:hypothetical protein n=1 Tax=Marivibrio sp. TaxID=2039719 RepID=UPI0032EA94CC
MNRRRLRDAAAALPAGAVLIFTPPYMRIYDQDWTVFGVPFLHVSLFALWFVGLVLSAALARRLIADEEAGEDGGVEALDAPPPSDGAEPPAHAARGD